MNQNKLITFLNFFIGDNSKIRKNIHYLYLPLLIVIITFITTFPYLEPGLSGYMPDLQYHLARIEGVRIALQSGHYPTKIYEFFYHGYGYGSPLFYPDIFLILPALIRMIGFEPIAAFKISVCIFTVLLVIIAYYSFCYITKNTFFSLVGTGLIALSQFYLADLQNRVGYSEYIAFLLLPLLFVAIYDLFIYDGRKIYLLGISLSGLLLCHTIMFFLSFCFTFFVFASFLLIPKYRKKIIANIIPIIVTAICAIGVSAFYIFPLMEQHFWGDFYYQKPWAHVGENVESLKILLFTIRGYFNVIAYVGIGIPIIVGTLVCIVPILISKKHDDLSRYFLLLGIAIIILMTDIFPWAKMDNTIFNMIQFTYRLYPFALMSIVTGLIIYMSRFELKTKSIILYLFGAILFFLSCFFGIIQNGYVSNNEDSLAFTEQYLIENATVTGSAEWVPNGFHGRLENFNCPTDVIDEYENVYEFSHPGYGEYTFVITNEEATDYSVPLFCYKGYSALITDGSGEKTKLAVSSVSGQVHVSNPAHLKGTVTVEYSGTVVQKASNMITIFTLIILFLYTTKKNLKGFKIKGLITED